MQYLIAGILKDGAEDRMIALRDEWNEHLSQPFRKVALFGALRNRDGRRGGYLAVIEAKDFDDAEAFLHQSPFYQNKLYERFEVAQFDVQMGNLE